MNQDKLIRKSIWFEPDVLRRILVTTYPQETLSLAVKRLLTQPLNTSTEKDTNIERNTELS